MDRTTEEMHINSLRLQAVLTGENFLPRLRKHNVSIRPDNTTVAQCIN